MIYFVERLTGIPMQRDDLNITGNIWKTFIFTFFSNIIEGGVLGVKRKNFQLN